MTLSKETIGSVIEKLEHFAQNLKWTDVRGAQDLLAAAEGLRELLERRERDGQEPVALCDERPGSGGISKQPGFNDLPHGTPLYAEPPAPVVQPVQVQDERASYEAFVEHRLGDCVDRRRAKNGDQEYMAWDMAMGWIVWQGRAAMLKQLSSIQASDSADSGAEIKHPASNSPAVPDSWIKCSERLPVEKDIVIVVDDSYYVCEAQYRNGAFYTAVRGAGGFFETTCKDVELWQPLPAAPNQEPIQ